jgi:hypothetical protein
MLPIVQILPTGGASNGLPVIRPARASTPRLCHSPEAQREESPASGQVPRAPRHGEPAAGSAVQFPLRSTRHSITVRRGKGQKDRRVMLPERVREDLRRHLESVRVVHRRDVAAGFGRVALPDALERKFPQAPTEWRSSCFPPRASAATPDLGRPAGITSTCLRCSESSPMPRAVPT